jgi:hypothetical protein
MHVRVIIHAGKGTAVDQSHANCQTWFHVRLTLRADESSPQQPSSRQNWDFRLQDCSEKLRLPEHPAHAVCVALEWTIITGPSMELVDTRTGRIELLEESSTIHMSATHSLTVSKCNKNNVTENSQVNAENLPLRACQREVDDNRCNVISPIAHQQAAIFATRDPPSIACLHRSSLLHMVESNVWSKSHRCLRVWWTKSGYFGRRGLHADLVCSIKGGCRVTRTRMMDGWCKIVYRIKHFFFSFFLVSSAARVACSKTSRTPSLVLAEHSRYFMAPIFLRTSSACVRDFVSFNCLVFVGSAAIAASAYLLRCHRLLRSLVQLLDCLLVKSQILLAADEDDGQALAEVQNFRDPL